MAGAAERETAGSRERGTLQCTALTICKLGLAEDTGPGVLGICERSEVEQRGLADEVLGPREADRAVGQRRVVRRAGCPRTKCFLKGRIDYSFLTGPFQCRAAGTRCSPAIRYTAARTKEGGVGDRAGEEITRARWWFR